MESIQRVRSGAYARFRCCPAFPVLSSAVLPAVYGAAGYLDRTRTSAKGSFPDESRDMYEKTGRAAVTSTASGTDLKVNGPCPDIV